MQPRTVLLISAAVIVLCGATRACQAEAVVTDSNADEALARMGSGLRTLLESEGTTATCPKTLAKLRQAAARGEACTCMDKPYLNPGLRVRGINACNGWLLLTECWSINMKDFCASQGIGFQAGGCVGSIPYNTLYAVQQIYNVVIGASGKTKCHVASAVHEGIDFMKSALNFCKFEIDSICG